MTDAELRTRKVRRPKSKADKANRRRAARRAAKDRARNLERFAAFRRRQIELHGIDTVRALSRKRARESRERQRALRPPAPPEHSGADVMLALMNAAGDTAVAAVALGLKPAALNARIRRCTVFVDGREEPMSAWRLRTWPPKPGRRAVDVARVEYEGTYRARERVYYLAAHGETAEGAHVVRVPAVGVERSRVVCKVCKEGRAT